MGWIDSRATQPRRVPAAGLPGKALLIPDSADPCTGGPCDPGADAARTAPGMLLQPTLPIGSRETLSTYREFRGRHLNKDNCRELVTPPRSPPRYGGPQLPPMGEGEERAARGRQLKGSLLKREAT